MSATLPFLKPATGGGIPVLLAPMAGFTDAAMRLLCQQAGAALVYTEMVNAIGLARRAGQTWHLLETLPQERHVVAHLYGSQPAEMAAAAELVWRTGRFVAIDVNAGCPMRKITRNGCGAALMATPAKIGAIVAAMVAATPLPVTVKTRVGLRPDQVLAQEILHAVTAAGGAALTVHGRFATQFHSGAVAYDLLAALKAAATIPIIGNGGVDSATAARRMVSETGVDAVMVGRAAMGNPWVFAEITAALADPTQPVGAAPARALSAIVAMLEAHLQASLALQRQLRTHYRFTGRLADPELAVALTFRCHLFRYLAGRPGAARLRGRLNTLHTLADIRAALNECLQTNHAT